MIFPSDKKNNPRFIWTKVEFSPLTPSIQSNQPKWMTKKKIFAAPATVADAEINAVEIFRVNMVQKKERNFNLDKN